ncbi:hypothetical protein EVAR_60910_1 [Eumeta japonica]|uniref:MADF domain-containing protein n=1 Tax=Eumeta variegata TaxID=151549 RepID=A0A4C1ZGK9_EUMVA|nr:hypothetical protein EVAR_60910_1 [Eumeta japonica]
MHRAATPHGGARRRRPAANGAPRAAHARSGRSQSAPRATVRSSPVAMSYKFDTNRFIAEVAKREALYRRDLDVDQGERMLLWREVGQRVYRDWHEIDKAEIYDRLIELQRRWRSLRDAYKRELRLRKANNGPRRRRQYIYYKQLKRILDPQQEDDNDSNSYEGEGTNNDDEPTSRTSATPQSDDERDQNIKEEVTMDYDLEDSDEIDPLVHTQKSTRKKRTRVPRVQKCPFREGEHVVVEPKIPTQRNRSHPTLNTNNKSERQEPNCAIRNSPPHRPNDCATMTVKIGGT